MDDLYYGMVKRERFEGFPKKHSWGLNAYARMWGINDFSEIGELKKDKKLKVKVISKIILITYYQVLSLSFHLLLSFL